MKFALFLSMIAMETMLNAASSCLIFKDILPKETRNCTYISGEHNFFPPLKEVNQKIWFLFSRSSGGRDEAMFDRV